MSETLKAVLKANARYAANFGARAELKAPPLRGFGILTCMDCRLDPDSMAGFREGDAQILRNAGGRASKDALRSIVIACRKLGAREWLVVHHTDCGMQSLTDPTERGEFEESLRALEPAGSTARGFFDEDDLEWLSLRDPRLRLKAAVERVRRHPLLPPGVPVHGLMYDVATGLLEVVDEGRL
ncbi:MAG TPA: carbonic anhydrase [Thermoanaerobaculia bacterium]|jgi:carbonic anhydrase